MIVIVAKDRKKLSNMWPEYTELLEVMRKNYELGHQLSNEAWKQYSETWQKSVDLDPDIQKKISYGWKNFSYEAGLEQMRRFSEMWENTLKLSSLDAMKAYSSYWQKFWFASTPDQFKAYSKALEKFTEHQNKFKKEKLGT